MRLHNEAFEYKTRVAPLLAGTCLVFTATVAAAPAEEQSTQSGESDTNQVLDKVVVTAQKREQSLQDVPVSVSVVDQAAIANQVNNSPGDIARLVPNLYGNPVGGRESRPRWFLRGVGVNTSSLVSPIGIYYDEVFQSSLNLHTQPLFDLDRVEVLRGPQGTLWGKNTTGGAIHFVSRKPTFADDGYVKFGLGNYDKRETQGAIGGGLTDTLAGRLSFYHEQSDGWAKNRYSGDEDAGALDDSALRGQLLFAPNDDVDVLLNLHYRTLDTTAVPGYPIGVRAGGADDFGYVAPSSQKPRIGDAINRNNDADGDLKNYGQSLTVNAALGEFALTSITAFEHYETEGSGDRDQSPNEVIRTYSIQDGSQFSQELRLTSPSSDRLRWIAGVYYFKDRQNLDETSATLPSTPQVFGTYYQNTRSTVDTESYALFGNVAYDFNDHFSVNTGLRRTWEEVGIDLEGVSGPARGNTVYRNTHDWWRRSAIVGPLRVNAVQDESNRWSDWTYDITPEWRLNEQALAFFRYAKGFRSGGYNATVTAQSSVNTVDPESIDSYELGVKTTWLDGRLTLNGALFYYEWQDMQLNIQGVTPAGLNASTLRNAALGKGKGLELELVALPLDNLRIAANLGLLSAKYNDFSALQADGSVEDYSGNRFARAPETTLGIDLQYRHPLPIGGHLVVGTDWAYQSRIYYNSIDQSDPYQQQAAYTLGNARLGYVSADEKTEVTGYIRNLTNKSYETITVVPANGAYRTTLGNPQTYGISLLVKF